MKKILTKQKGFTLIELLIAMVVSGIIVSGTILVFRTMVRNHNTEVKTLTMQQNLRSTMGYIERYIRMAGYDPTGSAGAGFTTLLSNNIAFTMDKGRDDGSSGIDDNPNGEIDSHWEEMIEFRIDDDNRLLRVDAGGAGRLLAEDIEVINFVYLDQDNNITTDSDDVKSVQVSIIVRMGNEAGFTNLHIDNEVYMNQQGTIILPAQNDNMRRLMLTADISCRNMAW